MKNVLILSALIHSFRNLHEWEISGECHCTRISGKNMSGKTNSLNAIYWCLCGITLDGSSDDSLNVPVGLTGERVVDVHLKLSIDGVEHTINRWADEKEGSISQHLSIDGVESATLKNGEIAIDRVLGLLELSLKDTKEFKVRRFIFNPNYYTTITPSALRKYFLSLRGAIDEKAIINASDKLSKVTKTNVLAGITTYGSFAAYSKAIDDNAKKIKELIKNLSFTKSYLTDVLKITPSETLDKQLTKANKDSFKFDENKTFIKEVGPVLSRNSVLQFANNCNLNLIFFEKGKDDDTWNEVCYPVLADDEGEHNFNLKQGSKCQLLLTNSFFVSYFAQEILQTKYPILVDDGECVDSNWIDDLLANGSQVFITCVTNSKPLVEAQ